MAASPVSPGVDIARGRWRVAKGRPDERQYTIGEAVAALRAEFPDVSHSSLRFLEREGLISAQRSPGGHRSFPVSEIDRIRQIKTWQRQRLSLREIRARLDRLARLPDPAALVRVLIDQATAGRSPVAYNAVIEALDAGLAPSTLFGEVLVPALTEVGNRWHRGELLVAQEKEFSELAREIITDITLRCLPAESTGPGIVAACVEGERHELGLRMLCGLLRIEGYAVHFLGADVAPPFLRQAVGLYRPAIVLLSAHTVDRLPDIRAAVVALNDEPGDGSSPRVFVGGQGAGAMEAAIRQLGAVPVAAARLEDALRRVRAALPVLHQPERPDQA